MSSWMLLVFVPFWNDSGHVDGRQILSRELTRDSSRCGVLGDSLVKAHRGSDEPAARWECVEITRTGHGRTIYGAKPQDDCE